jgi:hypothetical protein
MEPPRPAETLDLDHLRVDVLRRAVEVYLGFAYPSGTPPEAVRRRLDWSAGVEASTLLTRAPFEIVGKATATGGAPIFALRLGNMRYPHMKLQIQPWPNAAGFLLSVNTHDQVLSLDPNAADAQAFRDLQAENQRLKEAIEQGWDDEGLPTFHRYLREYIASRGDRADPAPRPGSEPGTTS